VSKVFSSYTSKNKVKKKPVVKYQKNKRQHFRHDQKKSKNLPLTSQKPTTTKKFTTKFVEKKKVQQFYSNQVFLEQLKHGMI